MAAVVEADVASRSSVDARPVPAPRSRIVRGAEEEVWKLVVWSRVMKAGRRVLRSM